MPSKQPVKISASLGWKASLTTACEHTGEMRLQLAPKEKRQLLKSKALARPPGGCS